MNVDFESAFQSIADRRPKPGRYQPDRVKLEIWKACTGWTRRRALMAVFPRIAVDYHLRELIDRGWIETRRVGRHSQSYWLEMRAIPNGNQ